MNSSPSHVIVVGAGAAGLMAGRTLARAGVRATVLEARERLGGRIWALPEPEFGYRAEGGPEFVHGPAPVTRRLAREAGLGWYPRHGARWAVRGGVWATTTWDPPHAERFRAALEALTDDLPVSAFLATYFAGDEYAELRRSVARMTEGYDAADVTRASTFAVRAEWIGRDSPSEGRLKDGYCALIDYLAQDCRAHGGEIRMGAEVVAIQSRAGRVVVRTR
ncbi:MAG: FAD-dependent oxidoreductase, partial [Alphaproteobacteria bacterium]|nr:FAD-dependent oxidoreductase [Alphaproteobacteria bacterium]